MGRGRTKGQRLQQLGETGASVMVSPATYLPSLLRTAQRITPTWMHDTANPPTRQIMAMDHASAMVSGTISSAHARSAAGSRSTAAAL